MANLTWTYLFVEEPLLVGLPAADGLRLATTGDSTIAWVRIIASILFIES